MNIRMGIIAALAVIVLVITCRTFLKTPTAPERTVETPSVKKPEKNANNLPAPSLPQAKTPQNATTAPQTTAEQKVKMALGQAQALVDAQEPEQAVALLKVALQNDPENADLLAELGMLYSEVLQKPSEARPYLEKAVQKAPDDGASLSELVSIYQSQKDFNGATNFLNEFVKNNPDNARGYMATADVLVAMNRPQDAIGYLEKAAQMPGADEGTQHFLAQTYGRIGTPEAIRKAEDTYQNLLGSKEKVIQDRRSRGLPTDAAELARDHALMDLVKFQIKSGNFADAHKGFAKLQETRPDDPQVSQISGVLQAAQAMTARQNAKSAE